MAVAECDFKHQVRLPTDHFKKLLEATCLNHMHDDEELYDHEKLG
jgi:hypothetical protein